MIICVGHACAGGLVPATGGCMHAPSGPAESGQLELADFTVLISLSAVNKCASLQGQRSLELVHVDRACRPVAVRLFLSLSFEAQRTVWLVVRRDGVYCTHHVSHARTLVEPELVSKL